MEDDIQHYLLTVMFCGTPCILSLIALYELYIHQWRTQGSGGGKGVVSPRPVREGGFVARTPRTQSSLFSASFV